MTAPAPTPTTAEPRRTTLLATLALLSVTAVWGSTFPLIKDLLERVPTLDFLAVRFLLAAVVAGLVLQHHVRALPRESLRRAGLLGLVYGVAQILQTAGLAHTAASVSGFVTGMYVVLTPLLAALLLRQQVNRTTWAAVALATVGLGVLTLEGVALGYGEAITLVAAALYALHIVGLGAWSRPQEALGLSVVQLAVIAVVCLVPTLPGGVVLPTRTVDWLAVVYTALAAGALALVAQTWAQGHLTPTRAAIIMSMEPVFAATFAVAAGEAATLRLLVGGALVLTAMLVVEALPGRRRQVEGEVQHLVV